MRKRLDTAPLLALALLTLHAAAAASTWFRQTGGRFGDDVVRVAATADGGSLAVARIGSFNSAQMGLWIVRSDAAGETKWQRRLDPGDVRADIGISRRPDGSFWIAAGLAKSVWMARIDDSGTILSQGEYPLTAAYSSYAHAVLATSDGGAVVVGRYYADASLVPSAFLLRVDASATPSWFATYGVPLVPHAFHAVAETGDGGFVAVGSTEAGANATDGWAMKVDASGAVVWQAAVGANGVDEWNDVARTSDGQFVAVGRSHVDPFDTTSYDGWVATFSAAGVLQNSRTFGGTGLDWLLTVDPVPGGGYVAGGRTEAYRQDHAANSHDLWLMRFDGTGTIAWQRTYHLPSYSNVATHLEVLPTGSLLVGGTTAPDDTYNDLLTLSLGADGLVAGGCAAAGPSGATPVAGPAGVATTTAAATFRTPARTSTSVVPYRTDGFLSRQCGDVDSDGVSDATDVCVTLSDPVQSDLDGDGKGDACDPCPIDADNDLDGDGICGQVDNCSWSTPRTFTFDGGTEGWTHAGRAPAPAGNDTWRADARRCQSAVPLSSPAWMSSGNAGPFCGVGGWAERSETLSPGFLLPSFGPISLEFDALDFDQNGSCLSSGQADGKDAGITTDGGASYTRLNECFRLVNVADGSKTHHVFNLAAWAGSRIQVQFVYDTLNSLNGNTFAVDDVALRFASSFNPGQEDADVDGSGDVCDLCTDTDADGFGNPGYPVNTCLRDNCPGVANATQSDVDADFVGDSCDRCPSLWDPYQQDADADGIGDRCDDSDGTFTLAFDSKTTLAWDAEIPWNRWNLYRGDLAVLRSVGEYTQVPGSNPLAGRQCGLTATGFVDAVIPTAGTAAFYLVTGVLGGVESGLGANGAGAPRPNAHPCP